LKIVRPPCFNEKSTDFDEIWYTATDLKLHDSHMTKYDYSNSRWRTAAVLKIDFWPLLGSRLPDFSETLRGKTVFHRISAATFHRRYFLFLMQFGLRQAGTFRIVSDTLVCLYVKACSLVLR